VGKVGSIIVVKGRKVRQTENYNESDPTSFKAALAKVSGEAQRMRKAAQVEAKSRRQGFRKKKTPKNV
jgi:hypothetical protein